VFAIWRRPWRVIQQASWQQRIPMIVFGVVLAAMNCCFYVAIDRLPLGTVGGIEFLGPIALAAAGSRTGRNLMALLLAVGGVGLLTNVRLTGEMTGFLFAFANCALFALYVILGDRLAQAGGERIDRLAAAMLIALVAVTPVGLPGAISAFDHPAVIAAGLGVGICSSVIPYVCDQLAMARLRRPTFALFLSLLPACAAIIGFLVLEQMPHRQEMLAIGAIVFGVAIHRDRTSDAARLSCRRGSGP
jgi:inner membrane transporter RhtA